MSISDQDLLQLHLQMSLYPFWCYTVPRKVVKEYAVSHSANSFVFGTIDSSSWTHVHTLNVCVGSRVRLANMCVATDLSTTAGNLTLNNLCGSVQPANTYTGFQRQSRQWSKPVVPKQHRSTLRLLTRTIQSCKVWPLKPQRLQQAFHPTLRSTDLLTMTMQRTWISVLKKH